MLFCQKCNQKVDKENATEVRRNFFSCPRCRGPLFNQQESGKEQNNSTSSFLRLHPEESPPNSFWIYFGVLFSPDDYFRNIDYFIRHKNIFLVKSLFSAWFLFCFFLMSLSSLVEHTPRNDYFYCQDIGDAMLLSALFIVYQLISNLISTLLLKIAAKTLGEDNEGSFKTFYFCYFFVQISAFVIIMLYAILCGVVQLHPLLYLFGLLFILLRIFFIHLKAIQIAFVVSMFKAILLTIVSFCLVGGAVLLLTHLGGIKGFLR
jgi:hypothetical protein